MAGPSPGSRLDRWYRRTPAEIAAEKARNAEAQQAAFYAPRAEDREAETSVRPATSSAGVDPWTLSLEQRELENEMLRETPSAAGDFVRNWSDMRTARTIDGDKYFHCKANFEAARRGGFGDFAAEKLSNLRESVQQRFFGESRADAEADQRPNHWGRRQARKSPDQSPAAACAPFRPRGLDPKY